LYLQHLKRLLLIVALLFAFGVTTHVSAQAKGGRKREHKNQRRGGGGMFGGVRKHHGNANMFARGGQKNGFLSRLFTGKRVTAGGWVYKPTRPGKKQNREQHQLFTRYRTKNKKMKDGMQARINRDRAKNRSHGNASFAKRKY
jgi:hypothetical protein